MSGRGVSHRACRSGASEPGSDDSNRRRSSIPSNCTSNSNTQRHSNCNTHGNSNGNMDADTDTSIPMLIALLILILLVMALAIAIVLAIRIVLVTMKVIARTTVVIVVRTFQGGTLERGLYKPVATHATCMWNSYEQRCTMLATTRYTLTSFHQEGKTTLTKP